MAGELTRITKENAPPIFLAMTGAAFDAARQEGVVGVGADLQAMADIAHDLSVIKSAEPSLLPPMILVARDTTPGREYSHDELLPSNKGTAQTGMFFSVGELTSERPQTANRRHLEAVAHYIGVKTFTEISISSWRNTSTHARAFGHALTTGQRPVDLPPARTIGGKILNFLASGFDERGAGVRAVERQRPMKPPFTFRYRDTDLQPRRP